MKFFGEEIFGDALQTSMLLDVYHSVQASYYAEHNKTMQRKIISYQNMIHSPDEQFNSVLGEVDKVFEDAIKNVIPNSVPLLSQL